MALRYSEHNKGNDMTDDFVSPLENPDLHEKILAGSDEVPAAPVEIPSAPEPPTFLRRLIAGYAVDDTTVVRDVEVDELTGVAEERLARVSLQDEPTRWVQTLLECAVLKIGDVDAYGNVLKDLLIGDRELLVLAVREATYGPYVEYGTFVCPECDEEATATVSIADVPIRPFDGERTFKVDFKGGGSATVRLPTGADQLAIFADANLTDAERKTLMLERVVLELTDKRGESHVVAGFPSLVKNLNIVKRNQILEAISERQPGPRYDEVVYKHDCGYTMPLPLGLVPLFPGL